MRKERRMIEEYLAGKKGEVVSPLEIADALGIPYKVVHEIFLELIREGKLEVDTQESGGYV